MTNLSISPEQAQAELAKRELARRHLKDFAAYVYDGYLSSWHTEILCEALEKTVTGEIRFLLIEAPPRHSKSLHVSQLFPAWIVGNNPDDSVIVSSYSGDLATDHGRETRNLINGKAYGNIFNTRLAPDSTAKGKWNTQKKDKKKEWVNAKGAYNAAGVGGSITGKGAEYFIIDDSLKDRKEADSQLIRDNIWSWFRSVARTRLTPTGRMIVMGTRWHLDDLAGRIMEEEYVRDYFERDDGQKWVRLRLPAIAEKDEPPFRTKGEALWPSRYSLDELNDIRKTLGTYEFEALYQQQPVSSEHQEFKGEYVTYETEEFLKNKQTMCYITIDSAVSEKDSADYTGVTINRVTAENKWYVKTYRLKINSRDLIDHIFQLKADHNPDFIGLEETTFTMAIKPFLEEEMRKRSTFFTITPLKHKGINKEVRIRGLIPRWENKSIILIGDNKELLEETSSFPHGRFDDVLDSLSMQLPHARPPARPPVTLRDRTSDTPDTNPAI